ncbi:MAG: hypothetical protein QN229_02560 [Desulfurococcaceae archaeon TW002]
MEIVIILAMGVLTGLLISKIINKKENTPLMKNLGKITLFLTYVLVFMIGLRTSQILPDVLMKGQHVVTAVLAFSAIPTILSFAISYIVLRS